MNTYILNPKSFVFILVTILVVTFGTQGISYAQEANPTIAASVQQPLTEATLNGNTVTLTVNGGRFTDSVWDIRDAVSVSGIDGVTFDDFFNVDRVSDTEVTVELTFYGNIEVDTTLTFTVEAVGIEGYVGPALTTQLPVTAVKETLVASTDSPLTETSLNGSVVTLTLSGRRFVEQSFGQSEIADALTFSGIEGIAVSGDFFESDLGGWVVGPHVSDNTELTVRLAFNGNFDTDATLTITVGAEAIVGYNKDFTVELPVAAVEQSDATVSISPVAIALPSIGEKLTLNLNIANGENVAGYQATLAFSFDRRVLRYVEGGNGDYLPADAFFTDSSIYHDWSDRFFVTIAGNTLAEASNGDGTLATLTFEVLDYNHSTVTLSNVYLVDADGKRWDVTTENGEVIEPPGFAEKIFGDLNLDGVVNIQDLAIVSNRFGLSGQRSSADVNGDSFVNIVDLVLVANAFGAEAAAPSLNPQILEQLTAADVKDWLTQARQLSLTDPAYLRGISVLEQLLMALTPKETALLPNFPNPFNPETWIPYHLSKDADVTLRIYAMNGTLVRTLTLGHQPAGIYQNRSRAAYWDGKNAFGEPVASGLYFYTLTAGDFTATRKMLIRK